MARSERGRIPKVGCNEQATRPAALLPRARRVAPILALAGVARWAEITRISTLRSRLGQRQYRQQRGPLQYFNSLLTAFPLVCC